MQHSFAKIIRKQRGFTMTELLVVIAITGILLGLLFVPIIQGFNLTRKASNQIQASTQARNGINNVAREIAQAVFVLDNTSAPVNFPLSFAVNVNSASTPTPVATWGNGAVVYSARVLYTKIDFIPSGRLGGTGAKDPTTGDTLGGSPVRFPLAPGTRMVRYFIGLKDNTRPYQNIYQRRTHSPSTASVSGATEYPFDRDSNLNPFVLYRAEFDPNDPKLFNLTNYSSAVDDNGGFNDPNFFYNYNVASNGQAYAANWKAIATAVVDGPNQDVISWVKDDSGDIAIASPFRPLISFGPGSVVGDTATPGFLTAAAAEVPNAVPTVYNTQQGHWSLPATLTFYRAANRETKRATDPNAMAEFGALKVSIDGEVQPDGTLRPHVHIDVADPMGNQGSLQHSATQLYCARIASTNEIFVKTPNLTFLVNLERGTVQTGFPPLAGDDTGAPLIRRLLANGTLAPPSPMMPAGSFDTAYPDVNLGELVETLYRSNTRDPRADDPFLSPPFPTNQGIAAIDVWDRTTRRYFLADGSDVTAGAAPLTGLTTRLRIDQNGSSASPLHIFGNVSNLGVLQPGGGLLIAAGTERVMGPDLSVTPGGNPLGLVAYYRAPAAISSVVKKASLVTENLADPNSRKRWTPITGQRTYLFDQDTQTNITTNLPMAILRFDNPGGPGLPSRAFTDTAPSPDNQSALAPAVREQEVQITYLWQNNFSRRDGKPVDAQGNVIGDKAIIAPEPDVVKADYSTRDMLTVNVGVMIYDSNTHQPSSISLTDKVRVNNTIR
ncbi:type II secretion system protein [Armatimonas sp.]|uniref:type II secretion system protein n=1 Tax=Armatimonas sp. TaxID=1872638 RepID=UPI0037520C21